MTSFKDKLIDLSNKISRVFRQALLITKEINTFDKFTKLIKMRRSFDNCTRPKLYKNIAIMIDNLIIISE